MKACYVFLTLSILLSVACEKKAHITPGTSMANIDSIRQVPVSFVPYTDTFYGQTFYSGGGTIAVVTGDSFANVYALHTTEGQIVFSSDKFADYGGNPYTLIGFNYNFAVNSDGYYKLDESANHQGTAYFTITKDSIYYNSEKDYLPDTYIIYYAGRKIGSSHTGR